MFGKINKGIFFSSGPVISEGWTIVRDLALECEQLGYDSLWLGDHLLSESVKLEAWTSLSALSSITKRIRLGHLVLCNSFRPPALFAKMAATLDNISGGRYELGIGSGWNEAEHIAYGYPFPSVAARTRMLRESLEIMKMLWTQDKSTFEGKYYKVKDAICEPKPVQKPTPPITIAGGGERYTLKLVASHADRCNPNGTVEEYSKKLKVLKKYCDEIGRNYEEIDKIFFSYVSSVYSDETESEEKLKETYDQSTHKNHMTFKQWLEKAKTIGIMGTPEECIDKIQRYVDIGVNYFVFSLSDPVNDKESLKFFANFQFS